MSERERLIELIGNIPIGGVPFKARFSKSVIEKITDQLLENGVIVPPVKVGGIVWVIYNKCVTPAYVVAVYVDKSGGMFDLKIFTEGLKSTINKDYTFDMVYITREQAEKALKSARSDERQKACR